MTLDWLEIAIKEVGVMEYPGETNNPRIQEYLDSVSNGLDSKDSIPWCSAFLNWVFLQLEFPIPNSLMAKKWLQWGNYLEKPKLGCIVVLKSPWHVWAGHVGIFIIQSHQSVLLLSGNSDDQVKFKLYPNSRVLGYRWPST